MGSATYQDLAGKSVLITGGGSGIGAEFVRAFVGQGANVAFVSLPDDPGEELALEVEKVTGTKPLFLPCDVRDIAALKNAIEQARDVQGPISVLVNNAARDDRHDILSLDEAAWDNSFAINLRPHYFTVQACAEDMKASGGSIINLGSNSANLGLAGYPAYVAAKAGIVGLTKALARELGTHGIRVNALIPGWVMTERQKELWATPEAVEACLRDQSLKKTISEGDIANAALFLASEASSMMSGQSLIVDGGRV